MRIQHNIMAMNAYRNYSNNTSALSKNLEKLSSGYKINRAGDDAAGLAISEKMRAQITGLEAAQKNVKDGISLVNTAEGALQEVQDMMNRMVYLAQESANGTFDNPVDRKALQAEVDQLRDEINRIADSANFNGIKLLDGSLSGGATSSDGVSFKGAEVATYQEAKVSVNKTDWSAATAGKDTFIIDGQTLVIDWANDTEAKKMFAVLASTTVPGDTDSTKAIAKQLEDFLNDQMKAQGLTGSVKVKTTGAAAFDIESTNKTYNSEVTFAGASNTDPTKSLGGLMFGSTAGESKVNAATKKYNGNTVVAGDVFTMNVNGVDLKVTGVVATKGTGTGTNASTMASVATSLQTAIQTAIGDYNTQLGLTPGTKDPVSGLTGLTAADFTVTVEDGSLKVKYSGDEEVNFNFSDIGDRTVASSLGLANGSSSAGGAGGLTLQIGDSSDSFNQLNVSVKDMHTYAMGINNISVATQAGAQAAVDVIKDAINYVSEVRGNLGAISNRLDHTKNNLGVMRENIQDAESAIRDTDVADEMMAYTKNNILVQSAQAMLAQANQVPQGVLQLLQ